MNLMFTPRFETTMVLKRPDELPPVIAQGLWREVIARDHQLGQQPRNMPIVLAVLHNNRVKQRN